jgi:PBP1b-binding outer membrane lipoprotein LpoB
LYIYVKLIKNIIKIMKTNYLSILLVAFTLLFTSCGKKSEAVIETEEVDFEEVLELELEVIEDENVETME